MDKKTVTAITLAAALFAIALPILMAVYLSNRQAVDAESARALAYARDVTHRNDIIGDQVAGGIENLVRAHAKDPCSDDNIERMRRLTVTSSRVIAFGFVSGNRLMCSSVGDFGGGIDLGRVDFSTPYPSNYRLNVEFPFAKGTKFVVIESRGYAAITDKDFYIDWKISEGDASVAAFSTYSHQSISSRGLIRPEWLDTHPDLQETTFSNSGYIVGIARSRKYRIGTIVALPIAHVADKTESFAMVLAPVGVVAGLVMAFAILYLGRIQLGLPAAIKTGLRRREFYLAYQPIVELSTGKWVGAEALIRWKRRNSQVVGPDLFIPAAEQSDLIQRITERVLELVTQDAVGLFQRYPDFHLSINLSSADLHSTRTIGLLQRLRSDLNAAPSNLIVEATERGLVKTVEGLEVIQKIRAAGISVAIDDFGTGYSSLSYLESFEFDFLKIDRSFVKSVDTEAATSHVAQHIIEMAKALKLELIAEGVETEAQARYLRGHGVHFAQGYLYAKPMTFAEFSAQMEASGG
jgi:sensor c-di-GMP phosphodiesterase-like protein